jgi:hypothetical protein
MEANVPPKYQWPLTRSHGVTTQKTIIHRHRILRTTEVIISVHKYYGFLRDAKSQLNPSYVLLPSVLSYFTAWDERVTGIALAGGRQGATAEEVKDGGITLDAKYLQA